MVKFFLYVVVCLLPCEKLPAQVLSTLDGKVLKPSTVEAQVESLRNANDVPGIAVGLIREGRVAYLQASGVRSRRPDLALTRDTVMQGASLTKAIFAYLVMQLVDERRIELDRSISVYLAWPLPEYSPYSDLAGEDRWRKLTFRILLDHTTGFANYRSFEDDHKLRFHWSPGSRYGYSGEGFNLAQFILEQGLKLDVAREIQTRVFDRFAMSRSSLTRQTDRSGDVARGYADNGSAVTYPPAVTVRAASSLNTTPRDFASFVAGLVRGEGLSAAAKAEMFRLQIKIATVKQFPTLSPDHTDAYDSINLGYGLGWGVFDSAFGHAFFKEGHDDGVANYTLCIQAREACILLMSNSTRAEGIFEPLVDELMGSTSLPWRWEGYTPFYQKRK